MKNDGLPRAVAERYECTQVPGVYITSAPGRVKIDLRKISLTQADELVKAGKLPMLKEKKGQTVEIAPPVKEKKEK